MTMPAYTTPRKTYPNIFYANELHQISKLLLLCRLDVIYVYGDKECGNQNNKQKPVIVKEYPDKDWQA